MSIHNELAINLVAHWINQEEEEGSGEEEGGEVEEVAATIES